QRRHDLREVIPARGLQCGALHRPHRRAVAIAAGCCEALVQDLRLLVRAASGRHPQPSVALVDSRTLRPAIQAQAKAPLRDAAAVNATRWALFQRLNATGLPLETGTGGRTKWNRTTRDLPKTHWFDAVCVGESTPERLLVGGVMPLLITAMGRHS